MRHIAVFMWGSLLAASLLAQTPAPEATPTPEPAPPAEAPQSTEAVSPVEPAADPETDDASGAPEIEEYHVGVGDVLAVTVFDNVDLSRVAPIQTNGTIALPLLGDVPVAGMTVSGVQERLTILLKRDYLVEPHVEVRVREYNSQFVFVVGEINQTGRQPLKGHTRLIDLLVDAGGFTASASGEVLITRVNGSFEDGSQALQMRLARGTLTTEDQFKLEVALRNGDIITASPRRYVTVEGEVSRTGRFALEEGLTVSGAISMAGGLTKFGGNKVKVRRVDPETGEPEIIEVNLKDVRNGKEPDLALQPNDVITVSRKMF